MLTIQLGPTTLTLSPAPRGNWLVTRTGDTDATGEFETLGAALEQLARTVRHRESMGVTPELSWSAQTDPAAAKREADNKAVGMRWYISAAALKQFIAICGLPECEDGPVWDRCESELSALCNEAKLSKDEGHRQIWRVMWRPTNQPTRRLELTVTTAPRPEGPLHQLVRVRDKGANRPGQR